MKEIILYILLLLIFTGCTDDEKTAWNLVGRYDFSAHEHITDDINCEVEVDAVQDFGHTGIYSTSNVKFTFHFNETFEFSDIELYYKIKASGDWAYRDSLLIIDIVQDNIKYDFQGSNAKRYVEESMVRYLRKYVTETVSPEIEKYLLLYGQTIICLDALTDSSMILSHPNLGRVIELKREK